MTTGLVMVITGNGKGKTTSALGMVLRSWGWGQRISVLQFIKNPSSETGERKALNKLEIEIITMGSGFTWIPENAAGDELQSRELWKIAREKLSGGNLDLLVLDEITYTIEKGWIPLDEVLSQLKCRPPSMHVIITGRRAAQSLMEFADSVIEVNQLKHHLARGIKAQPGVEF